MTKSLKTTRGKDTARMIERITSSDPVIEMIKEEMICTVELYDHALAGWEHPETQVGKYSNEEISAGKHACMGALDAVVGTANRIRIKCEKMTAGA